MRIGEHAITRTAVFAATCVMNLNAITLCWTKRRHTTCIMPVKPRDNAQPKRAPSSQLGDEPCQRALVEGGTSDTRKT